MSNTAVPAPSFADAAKRVRAWVTLRRWLNVLRMTVIPAVLVLVLLTLFLLRHGAGVAAPWLGLVSWLAGALAYAWWRRPGEYSALALWDEAAGRREAFASAWWFEQRPNESEGGRVHVATQQAVLPEALPRLRYDLPLKPDRWLALPVAVALLGSVVTWGLAPPSTALVMDGEMALKAAEAGKKLAQMPWDKKRLQALDEAEKKQVEELKQKLQQTADDLANASGKDARSVLAELERRAREAEKLADDLAKSKEEWASQKLIDALRQHADAADLGDAVAAKNAQAAAQAAATLSAQLKDPKLNDEAKQRLAEMLRDAQRQADKEDRQRIVGQSVLDAGDKMQQGSAPGAGDEFQKLAEKLRDLELREQSRKELQQLAQQLRESGSSIAGQQEGKEGAMQQMSQAGQEGQQQNGQNTPQVGQTPGGSPQQQGLQPPGMGQQGRQNQMGQGQPSQNGQGQQQMMMAQGQQGQPGQPGGTNQPGEGQPMLLAPVPGTPKADPNGPVMLMQGESPPDQPPDAVVMLPMAGGERPGAGKADLNNTPTEKIQTGGESMVQAQQNAEGKSTVKTVEGSPRPEQAARSATETALETIQAEEAALDEAALPQARREQVRRYFNELRKRFEKP